MKRHASALVITVLFAALSGMLRGAEPEQRAPLYPFVRDGKWGYIDSTGASVIQPRFGRCVDVFEGDRVRVWEGKKCGYIDRAGQWIVEPKFTDGLYGEDAPFEVVSIGNKQGVLARSGQRVLPVTHDKVILSGDRAWVRDGEELGVFALDGHWILKPSLSWPRGRRMPEPTDGGSVSWFARGRKWGLLSRNGKVLFEPRFQEHEMGRKESEEWNHPEGLDFKNHRAWVTEGKDFLLISNEGKILTRKPFTAVREWTDELYVFTNKDQREGLISRDGEVVLAACYHEIKSIEDGRAVVVRRIEKSKPDGGTETFWDYGYIDEQGRVVVAPGTYHGPGVESGGGQTELAPFSEGLAPVWNNDPESSKRQVSDPCAGYIDRSGALVIAESFYRTKPFSEGLGAVQERKPRQGMSHKGGLWGYVDKTGAMVIAPQFGYVTPFCRDRAWALKAGARWDEPQWAMIDRTGKVLTGFAYEPPERRSGWRYKKDGSIMKSRWRGDLAVLTRGDFHNGLATASGKVLAEPIHNRIGDFKDGVAVVEDIQQVDKSGSVTFVTRLLTQRGEILADGTYTAIRDFEGGVAWASHRQTDNQRRWQHVGWGLIDTSAKEIGELKYVGAWWVRGRNDSYTDNLCPKFYGELAPVAITGGYKTEGLYTTLLTNGWGYMNRAGKIVAWQDKSPDP